MHLIFDSEKAIEVILYITRRTPNPDIYHVLKIIYFADKQHLEEFGRLICNDNYIAMRHGPVPSNSYDIIKHVRGDGHSCMGEHARNSFEVQKQSISPYRDANLVLLSESDKECLDNAISQYGHLSFDALKKISHNDPAFKAADENDFMPIESIAVTLKDGKSLIEHLRTS